MTVRANRHRGTPPAHLLMSRSTLGNFAPNPRAIRGPCSPTPQAGVAAKLCRSDLRAPGPGRSRPSWALGAFVPSPAAGARGRGRKLGRPPGGSPRSGSPHSLPEKSVRKIWREMFPAAWKMSRRAPTQSARSQLLVKRRRDAKDMMPMEARGNKHSGNQADYYRGQEIFSSCHHLRGAAIARLQPFHNQVLRLCLRVEKVACTLLTCSAKVRLKPQQR